MWDHQRAAAEQALDAELKRNTPRPKDPNRRTMSQSFRVVTRAQRDEMRKELGWRPPKQQR